MAESTSNYDSNIQSSKRPPHILLGITGSVASIKGKFTFDFYCLVLLPTIILSCLTDCLTPLFLFWFDLGRY